MNKYVKVFLFALIVPAISGVIFRYLQKDSTVPVAEAKGEEPKPPVVDPGAALIAECYNKRVIDSAVSILHTGNIVLRTGLGADSYLLSQMNRKDQTYSHCGIVMVEYGYPFVYHSIGGEDNPDERLRRDSATSFFSPLHNSGLAVITYDYGDSGLTRLQQVVTNYYRLRPKFDLKFDLKTDDKLYCAEFVYKALNKAMNDSSFIKPTVIQGFTFVGVDDLFVNDHAHFIWQVKYK